MNTYFETEKAILNLLIPYTDWFAWFTYTIMM